MNSGDSFTLPGPSIWTLFTCYTVGKLGAQFLAQVLASIAFPPLTVQVKFVPSPEQAGELNGGGPDSAMRNAQA